MSTEQCTCPAWAELSAFGRSVKHASHHKECPMYQEPSPEQKENARRKMVQMGIIKVSPHEGATDATA